MYKITKEVRIYVFTEGVQPLKQKPVEVPSGDNIINRTKNFKGYFFFV